MLKRLVTLMYFPNITYNSLKKGKNWLKGPGAGMEDYGLRLPHIIVSRYK